MIDLDKLDFGIELKEIIESYKLGLEVNIKGRNLLTPLLQKEYECLIENLKNTLFIPSYTSRREVLCMIDLDKKGRQKKFEVPNLNIYASPDSSHQPGRRNRCKI